MTQQLDTNANINASASAVVNTDALTRTTMQDTDHKEQQTITESVVDAVLARVGKPAPASDGASVTERVESMGGAITTIFETTFSQLVALRDSHYSAGIEELEQESNRLSEEYDRLEQGIASLEAILPSEIRLNQHQVDELLVSGKPDAARDKRTELAEFKRKPIVMREQQKEIQARLEAIASEKRAIAKQVFEQWLAEVVQPVVREAERGLFITLLDRIEQSMYQYQDHTNTGTADNRQRPLINQGHISGLTADERSAEWQSGTRRYGGRR